MRNSKRVFKQYHSVITVPTKYPLFVLLMLFPSVFWDVIPLLLLGAKCQLKLFFDDLTMKYTPKIRGWRVQLVAIGASACPMAAFSGFYESPGPPPLGDACSIVPSHCHGHQNGRQSGHILYRHFVCCHSGGHWGNTEQIVTRWRHLVAFIKALDLLHRAILMVLHHRTAMAIKMASDRGTSVRCCRLFCLIKT